MLRNIKFTKQCSTNHLCITFVIPELQVGSTAHKCCKGWRYHGLCGSKKLLYKRCPKPMGRPKFRPPTAPTFFNRS